MEPDIALCPVMTFLLESAGVYEPEEKSHKLEYTATCRKLGEAETASTAETLVAAFASRGLEPSGDVTTRNKQGNTVIVIPFPPNAYSAYEVAVEIHHAAELSRCLSPAELLARKNALPSQVSPAGLAAS